jgi:hypothetical protein
MIDPRVYKYDLEVTDAQLMRLPAGSRILSVQEQRGVLRLWALADVKRVDVERWVYIVGTGNPAPASVFEQEYIGTVQTNGGVLVWHVFVGPEL